MPKMTKEYRETTNRSVYNKARKYVLEHNAEIRCSYCGYHMGENCRYKYYFIDENDNTQHLPTWKILSKNKKQWMHKTYAPEIVDYRRTNMRKAN